MPNSEELQQQIDDKLTALELLNNKRKVKLGWYFIVIKKLIDQLRKAAFEEGRQEGEQDAREHQGRPLGT